MAVGAVEDLARQDFFRAASLLKRHGDVTSMGHQFDRFAVQTNFHLRALQLFQHQMTQLHGIESVFAHGEDLLDE